MSKGIFCNTISFHEANRRLKSETFNIELNEKKVSKGTFLNIISIQQSK